MEAVIQRYIEKIKEMESELQQKNTNQTDIKRKNVQIQALEKIIQKLKDEKIKNDESYEK